nr:tripartite tricarboxylate transporter substrate binding protein [Allopusillimonas soli]
MYAHASSDSYPEHPIRTIVPFAPGGNADVTARLVTDALSKKLGQPFVIENKSGAGGLVGGTAVARAKPDGYTIMSGTGGPIFASAVVAGTRAPYTLRDLAPIGRISTVPLLLVVNSKSPYSTFDQFAASSKKRSGKLSVGHAGHATTNHVSVLQLQKALKTTFIVTPYKGSSPAIQDLIGNQIDAVSAEATACLQYVKSGQLRALAIIGSKRLPSLPNVPTMSELKIQGVNVTTFAGMMAPAHTPQNVINQLSQALSEVLHDADFIDHLERLGGVPAYLPPVKFSAFLVGEKNKYTRLVEEGLIEVK